MKRLQKDRGYTDPNPCTHPRNISYDPGKIPAAATDKDLIGCGESTLTRLSFPGILWIPVRSRSIFAKHLRCGSLDDPQIPRAKLPAIGTNEFYGIPVLLKCPYLSGIMSKLNTYAPGPRSDIPNHIVRAGGKLREDHTAHFLLRHGYLTADKFRIRNACGITAPNRCRINQHD